MMITAKLHFIMEIPKLREIGNGLMSTPVATLKVLLVEDSPLLSDRLLELLSDIPGVVTLPAVATEAGAIAAIAELAPDVLILDLRLKEGTGFGVLRVLKLLKRAPTVVILTNYALPQYRLQAEAFGVPYFLDKARDFDQLPTVLAQIMSTQKDSSRSPH